jgi:hypothetical protein
MSSRLHTYGSKGPQSTNVVPAPIPRKVFPISYAEPDVKDAAVILAFFNPAKSVRIIQNYLMVKHMLDRANIPTYVGEVAIDADFCISPATNVFQYTSSSYMFYKENLIQTVEKHIPEQYTKIITIDADVMFDNPNWYAITSRALDTYTAVQMFERAHWLSIDYKILTSSEASAKIGIKGHPGFAWAFQRSWMRTIGIYEYNVMGSGDAQLYEYFSGNKLQEFALFSIPQKTDDITMSYVKLDVYHLFHGLLKNRKYYERDTHVETTLKQCKIKSITDCVYRRDDAILEWKPEYKDVINGIMKAYFQSRNDDGV